MFTAPQRCFYLFGAVLGLVMAVLLLEPAPRGRVLLNASNVLVVVAAVAAVGRTQLSLVIALLLAAPTLLFQLLAINEGDSRLLLHSWCFGAALYGATIGYLLRYVCEQHRQLASIAGAPSALRRGNLRSCATRGGRGRCGLGSLGTASCAKPRAGDELGTTRRARQSELDSARSAEAMVLGVLGVTAVTVDHACVSPPYTP